MVVLDMKVAIVLVVSLAALKDMYHLAKQLLQSPTRLERRWYHRHTQQRTELVHIQFVAAQLQFIKHIQRTNHTQVHIHQLGGKIQVTLYV